MNNGTAHRDEGNWARNTGPLQVGDGRDKQRAVEGRRVTGPIHGFGRLWQKTYRVQLPGVELTPAEVVAQWKAHYADFWPDDNRFLAPLAGLEPGEVGLITGRLPGGPRLSTGVLVLYADEVSWAFLTPEGHPFAGFITFSVEDGTDGLVAQIQALLRAHDPLVELSMPLYVHRAEDRIWRQTLRSLAAHFGVDADPITTVTCVDRKRQWRRFGNIRRSRVLGALAHPLRR